MVFPTEIVLQILSYLDLETLSNLASKSTYFSSVINFDRDLKYEVFIYQNKGPDVWEDRYIWAAKIGNLGLLQWVEKYIEDVICIYEPVAFSEALKHGQKEVYQWLYFERNIREIGPYHALLLDIVKKEQCESLLWLKNTFEIRKDDINPVGELFNVLSERGNIPLFNALNNIVLGIKIKEAPSYDLDQLYCYCFMVAMLHKKYTFGDWIFGHIKASISMEKYKSNFLNDLFYRCNVKSLKVSHKYFPFTKREIINFLKKHQHNLVKYDSFEVLEWFQNIVKIPYISVYIITSTLESMNLKALTWLKKKEPECDFNSYAEEVFSDSLQHRKLEVVIWLCYNFTFSRKFIIEQGFKASIKMNKLKLAKLLYFTYNLTREEIDYENLKADNCLDRTTKKWLKLTCK
jgi:hypothetical protein